MTVSRRGFLHTLTAGTMAGSLGLWPVRALADTAEPDRTERDHDGFLLLNSNENAYGPSAKVIAAAQGSLSRAHRYPDREYDALIGDIARLHKIDKRNVLLGCGSTDILRVAAAALHGPGKSVITASPTFEDLATYSTNMGAEVVGVPLTATFAHDLKAMRARATGSASLIYICNPNNPTASLTPRADLESFIASLPDSVYVLIDEAYHHYVSTSARYLSFLDRPVANRRVIVLRTFSKIYGMAGLRLGYAVADPEVVNKMRPYLTDVDLNCAAVAAGRAALADTENARSCAKKNTDDRQEFFNQAMARMLKPIDSHANFVMLDAHAPADEIIAHFLENKVRIGRHFPPLSHHIRVSLGTPEAMNEFWRVWDLLPRSGMSM